MQILINNTEQAEQVALLKAIERALGYSKCSADSIEISIMPRGTSNNPEWLQYGINIFKNGLLSIYIAMIQRTLTSEFEFHS